MARTARSIEELFPVIAFSRAGDLKRVREWIEAGSPVNLPPGKKTRRQSPLQIAIDKGFLTLAEVLLDGGADPKADGALAMAVDRGRVDLARLLLDRGVPLEEVSFTDVCCSHHVDMIRLFLERGADPVAGAPFYHGLTQGLQPLIGLLKDLLAKDRRLQPQADDALVHYIEEKNPRGVSLLVWAGAHPDAVISDPSSDEKSTPLEWAASRGGLAVLKALKPESFPNLLPKLLQSASVIDSTGVADYLLSLGAPLNDRDDGTCSLLDALLARISWDTDPSLASLIGKPERVDGTISRIEELLKQGAKFPPVEARHLRRQIRSLETGKLARLLAILKAHGAFTDGFLLALIATPKMREALGARWPAVRNAIQGNPDATGVPSEVQSARRREPKPLLPIADLRQNAEAAVLGVLLRHPCPHFTVRELSQEWSPGEFRRKIGMSDEDKRDATEILGHACRKVTPCRMLEGDRCWLNDHRLLRARWCQPFGQSTGSPPPFGPRQCREACSCRAATNTR